MRKLKFLIVVVVALVSFSTFRDKELRSFAFIINQLGFISLLFIQRKEKRKKEGPDSDQSNIEIGLLLHGSFMVLYIAFFLYDIFVHGT